MGVRDYNREAWDREVERGNEWTVPAAPDVIEAARQGRWEIVLTETKPVPKDWFPDLEGADVLCFASGGGQQATVIAAAGANVTVLDNSPGQLAQDRLVAERDGLALRTVEGDMADLSVFPDGSFDLVFHPVSNLFAPAVRHVWAEAFRVLRRRRSLLAGFLNPAVYIFDVELVDISGELQVRYTLPYADATSKSEKEVARQIEPLEFSHTLEDPIAAHMPTYIATRAIKQ
jgi:ubiquinone/menaquinone biosynthesis C-methylase UbiE